MKYTYKDHTHCSRILPLTREETEIKEGAGSQDSKVRWSKEERRGTLTFTDIQVSEILETVCVHLGVDTHPICDKFQM